MDLIRALEKKFKKPKFPQFASGDTVQVHVKIVEGEKSRVQIYEGVVLRVANGGLDSSFTVRKISNGIGVERTFPFYSPSIDRIDVLARAQARQSRLFYLRKLAGKAARLDSELEFAGTELGEAAQATTAAQPT